MYGTDPGTSPDDDQAMEDASRQRIRSASEAFQAVESTRGQELLNSEGAQTRLENWGADVLVARPSLGRNSQRQPQPGVLDGENEILLRIEAELQRSNTTMLSLVQALEPRQVKKSTKSGGPFTPDSPNTSSAHALRHYHERHRSNTACTGSK
ncbi:hypothetical protein EJ08DRAFT_683615 [Tothia fuscella]|uniref:Uncharacterized protein n=1 Tax=Tothia fuscella TaxID=1048955 RepID=A0A9P4TTE4_9PEZI|nr:hypothetical protein EJ08DRAFT_683615 [Tothia fuscella]